MPETVRQRKNEEETIMKKSLALGMAIVMAASLTACGGGSGDTATTAASSETTALIAYTAS